MAKRPSWSRYWTMDVERQYQCHIRLFFCCMHVRRKAARRSIMSRGSRGSQSRPSSSRRGKRKASSSPSSPWDWPSSPPPSPVDPPWLPAPATANAWPPALDLRGWSRTVLDLDPTSLMLHENGPSNIVGNDKFISWEDLVHLCASARPEETSGLMGILDQLPELRREWKGLMRRREYKKYEQSKREVLRAIQAVVGRETVRQIMEEVRYAPATRQGLPRTRLEDVAPSSQWGSSRLTDESLLRTVEGRIQQIFRHGSTSHVHPSSKRLKQSSPSSPSSSSSSSPTWFREHPGRLLDLPDDGPDYVVPAGKIAQMAAALWGSPKEKEDPSWPGPYSTIDGEQVAGTTRDMFVHALLQQRDTLDPDELKRHQRALEVPSAPHPQIAFGRNGDPHGVSLQQLHLWLKRNRPVGGWSNFQVLQAIDMAYEKLRRGEAAPEVTQSHILELLRRVYGAHNVREGLKALADVRRTGASSAPAPVQAAAPSAAASSPAASAGPSAPGPSARDPPANRFAVGALTKLMGKGPPIRFSQPFAEFYAEATRHKEVRLSLGEGAVEVYACRCCLHPGLGGSGRERTIADGRYVFSSELRAHFLIDTTHLRTNQGALPTLREVADAIIRGVIPPPRLVEPGVDELRQLQNFLVLQNVPCTSAHFRGSSRGVKAKVDFIAQRHPGRTFQSEGRTELPPDTVDTIHLLAKVGKFVNDKNLTRYYSTGKESRQGTPFYEKRPLVSTLSGITGMQARIPYSAQLVGHEAWKDGSPPQWMNGGYKGELCSYFVWRPESLTGGKTTTQWLESTGPKIHPGRCSPPS